MKTRGQIAFESLLVLLVVITTATMITTLYIQIHNETMAINYARTATLEELSAQSSDTVIEKIFFQKSTTSPKIIITLSKNTQINTEKIREIIQAKTSIQNLEVLVESLRQ
jgi:uncharacterized protein (UPF0333 family)